jgi:aspartyl-tRNA(Asn)/glutamyl-tRNA(Gln) amidotransferase subunit A
MQAAAEALDARQTTSRDLVEGCLARIAEPAGQGGAAFIRVYGEQARASADAADALRRAGRAPSRYAGIPVAIKDLFDVAGETTQAGSKVLAGSPAARVDAPVIARLLQAGLVLIGRTNMTEFAFSGVGINPHFGTPLSPWQRGEGHIPGGSSSGAAVAVSDGFALGAIGTDTGGSCRIPAALCGIAGFKPTQRRVPLAGALPLSPTLDSVGPLAPSAACCAVLDAILAGEPNRVLPDARVAGLRLLLPTNLAFEHLDGPTEDALDRAVARLDAAGALIDRRPLLALDEMNTAHARGGFAAAEAYSWHRGLLADRAGDYDPRVASRILTGADMSAADYIALCRARVQIMAHFEAEMADYDAFMLPTVPIAPPRLSDFESDEAYRRLNFLLLRNPSTVNFLDGCAISIPCHATGAPPAGLMLAAPAMHDAALLAIAGAVEAVIGRPGLCPEPVTRRRAAHDGA